MVDIVEETLAELQAEKRKQLLTKYGIPTGLLLIVFLTFTGVKIWWEASSDRKTAAEGMRFLETVKNMKEGENNAAILENLMDGESLYASIAGLNIGVMQAYAYNFDDSAKVYATLSSKKGQNKPFAEYANLMNIIMELSSGKLSNTNAISKLQPITQKDSIFKATANELKAALLLDEGNIEQARPILIDLLKNESTPAVIKGRAYEMLLIATPKST
jgi:hypothetical protein